MKRLTLLLLLFIAFPFLDACDPFDCGCGDAGHCDYNTIHLSVTRSYQPQDSLTFTLYADDVDYFADQHSSSFGASLMACSCVEPEPAYQIKQLRVYSYPSYFADEADSSDISELIRFYSLNDYKLTNIQTEAPQFSYCGDYFYLFLGSKPSDLDTTYSFRFFLTKTNDALITTETTRISLE